MDVTATVWTLLPPIIAIALALITKEVYSSLMIGILSGALLYTGFHPLKAVETTFTIMGTFDIQVAPDLVYTATLSPIVHSIREPGSESLA